MHGAEMRESLDLRDWEKAQQKIREWEAEGTPIQTGDDPMIITQLCQEFISDAEARHLARSTMRKYKQLTKQIQAFAEQEGLQCLKQWDAIRVRQFRESWSDGALSAAKKLERLRALFRFAHESGWVAVDPAAKLKNPIVRQSPTMPFSNEEMAKILEAIDDYGGERNKIRAFILLMRYSGLRVGDAARLARDRIADGKLFLYTAKAGTPVWLPLPRVALEALDSFRPANGTYFFWSGGSSPDTVAKLWMRKLQRLFGRTKIPNAHSHRFRDTFAVELLLAGVPLERVSVLLGHRSIKVTEKHYAPWVRARQEQLEADVMASWERDSMTKGTPKVHAKSKVINFSRMRRL